MKDYKIEEDEIDLKEIFYIIKKNLFTIFSITFLFLFLTLIYLYFSKNTYSASTIISLNSKNSGGLGIGAMLNQAGFGGIVDNIGTGSSDTEKAKIVLTSKKFLNTILNKLNIEKEFFILKNFRKVEIEKLPNLNIEIEIYNKDLYDTYFKIIPINDKEYLLEIDSMDYSKKLFYNKTIKNDFFKIKIKQISKTAPYDINTTRNNLIQDIIDKNFNINKRIYLFKVLDKNMQLEKLIKNISIEDKKSNMLEIKYQGTIPKKVFNTVSIITNSFIDFQVKEKNKEYNRNLGIVNKYINNISKDINNQIKKIEKFQTKNIIAINIDTQELVNNIYTNKQELEKILLQITEIDNFIKSLKKDILSSVLLTNVGININPIQKLIDNYISVDSAIRELELQKLNIDKSVTSNPQIESFIKELKEKRNLLETLLTDFTEEHPQVIKQKIEIENLISKIYKNIDINLDKLKEEKRIIVSTILANISMVKKNLLKRVKLLKKEIAKEEKILNSIPPNKIASDMLNKTFKFNEKVYSALLNRKIDIEIDKSSLIANTKILENAYIPEKRDKPKVGLILIVSAIVGFIMGIFIIFFREFLNKKIREIKDIENITNIPIYGILDKTKNIYKLKNSLVKIKTNIDMNQNKKIVLITTTNHNLLKLKKDIVKNLAQIIAEGEEKVLIIDFDYEYSIIDNKKIGIIDYILNNNVKIEKITKKIDNYIDVISFGNTNLNRSDLLLKNKFQILINQLKPKYNYILFNTPIAKELETKILFTYSNINLFVFKRGISTIDEVEELKRLALKDGLDGVGIILN
jgi:uncharacterized protein involved in exopolysaccharide biosynthesis